MTFYIAVIKLTENKVSGKQLARILVGLMVVRSK